MNIEKIKNYNQKMLAVLGTLGAVLLLIFIILMLQELNIFNRRRYHDTPSGLIAGDKAEQLNQENLRKQIVSYESPWLIDTLKSVYIIPVSITTLKKPEEIMFKEEGVMYLADSFSDFSKSKDGYYNQRRFMGDYANLIIYYPLENRTLSLFNERILIGSVDAFYFRDDILLVFYAADTDTGKDGMIDLNDTRNLYVYSLHSASLRKISDSDHSVCQYQFIENSKNLLIEFSLNQYKDKQFNSSRTPCKIMKYEYESQKLSEVVPAHIQAEMQKLIEGK